MSESIKGRIHQVESFGSVDGPGVRYIVFLKGCHMRCRYCHNPETWKEEGGELSYYKVGENHLRKLTMDKQEITGELADHYVLNKE